MAQGGEREGRSPTGKIAWLWKQVEKARESSDHAAERECLERLMEDPAVRGSSDEDLALLGLCRLDLSEGRSADVARRLSSFEWHGIPGPAALLLAADIFLRLDWFSKALENLEEYLAAIPEDLDARRKAGLVLLMLDRDAEAERMLVSTARREQHRVPATLAYLAMLEAKRGRLEESLHLLLQARDLAPFDERIEHTLLQIEALRVRLKRGTMARDDLPFSDLVPAMAAGMLRLHGYGRERAAAAEAVWKKFCASREKPGGRKPAIWAAALEYLVTRSGPHHTQDRIALDYGVSVTQLREHLQEMETALGEEAMPGTDLLSSTARDGSELAEAVRQSRMVDALSDLTGRLSAFETPAEAVEWAVGRVSPVSEEERRLLEDFIAWIWERRDTAPV